jgi:hypothetical protein
MLASPAFSLNLNFFQSRRHERRTEQTCSLSPIISLQSLQDARGGPTEGCRTIRKDPSSPLCQLVHEIGIWWQILLKSVAGFGDDAERSACRSDSSSHLVLLYEFVKFHDLKDEDDTASLPSAHRSRYPRTDPDRQRPRCSGVAWNPCRARRSRCDIIHLCRRACWLHFLHGQAVSPFQC